MTLTLEHFGEKNNPVSQQPLVYLARFEWRSYLYPSPTQTDACIKTFRNDIGQTIINGELNINFRMRFRNVRIAGNNIVFAASSAVLIRNVPDEQFCSSLRDARAESMSCNIGPEQTKRCSPASVGTTLRVVRVRSRNPNRSST